MEALAGNHTEALHGHEGRIVLLEEDSSRTHFILGDVDRRLIELERDIPPQEGDSGSGDTSDSMLSVTWYSISALLCYIT